MKKWEKKNESSNWLKIKNWSKKNGKGWNIYYPFYDKDIIIYNEEKYPCVTNIDCNHPDYNITTNRLQLHPFRILQ